jgi:uncharacterized protein YutE (UPF0331/DUF86 family)
MRLDLDRIQAKRQFIDDNLAFLRELAAMDESTFVSDRRSFYAAVHALQISIGAMLDVCAHIVARLHLGVPRNDRETLEALRDKGVISQEHFQRYFEMSKFRNKVVHGYIDVNAPTVYQTLQNDLGDFDLFFADVKRMIAQEQERDAETE